MEIVLQAGLAARIGQAVGGHRRCEAHPSDGAEDFIVAVVQVGTGAVRRRPHDTHREAESGAHGDLVLAVDVGARCLDTLGGAQEDVDAIHARNHGQGSPGVIDPVDVAVREHAGHDLRHGPMVHVGETAGPRAVIAAGMPRNGDVIEVAHHMGVLHRDARFAPDLRQHGPVVVVLVTSAPVHFPVADACLLAPSRPFLVVGL